VKVHLLITARSPRAIPSKMPMCFSVEATPFVSLRLEFIAIEGISRRYRFTRCSEIFVAPQIHKTKNRHPEMAALEFETDFVFAA
jgi:hypothetical protein